MLVEYFLPTLTKEDIVVIETMKVLTSKIYELKKLKETRLKAIENTREQQWRWTLWSQNHNHPKSFKLGDFVL